MICVPVWGEAVTTTAMRCNRMVQGCYGHFTWLECQKQCLVAVYRKGSITKFTFNAITSNLPCAVRIRYLPGTLVC